MGEKGPQYSFDKAQEEAARMTAKVEAGQAKDYPEAEKLVEKERGELAPILVPVEQLIPGIKPKDSAKLTTSESRNSGYGFGDVYAEGLPRQLNRSLPRESVGRCFENQIVVDLGAGNMYGYYASVHGKAKGYIGVDKFRDLSTSYREPKKVQEMVDKFWGYPLGEKRPLIPVAIEVEDMLTFLRRLPDNSVSIISSGHFQLIQNQEYIDEVGKEMERVLIPDGLLVVNDGITVKDESAVKRIAGYSSEFEVLAKEKLGKK